MKINFGVRLGKLFIYKPQIINLPKWYFHNKNNSNLSRKKVSIITPVYNQSKYIEQTIKSVLNQKYNSLEYIVIDGGSTDGTIEIINKYKDSISYFESCTDKGQSNAINKGMKQATGDILAWVNGDDILLPGALESIVSYFELNPDVDVIYGDRIIINSDGLDIGRWVLPRHSDKVLLWVDFIPQESIFWRRSIWDKIGSNINESFNFALDWEMLLRMLHAGAKFSHLPRFIGAFRVHPEQKTQTLMSTQGLCEIQKLHRNYLGCIPARHEILIAIFPYLIKHFIADRFRSIRMLLSTLVQLDLEHNNF